MSHPEGNLKQRLKHEFQKFIVYFVYLALFFCSFIFYRNLVVANFTNLYLHYSFGIIEALVIAKIILTGQILHLGENHFANYPLIVPTLYKASLFSLLVIFFGVVEHYVSGWVHGHTLQQMNLELTQASMNDIFARALVKYVAFIPFFGFLELERVMGEGKVYKLFFRSELHRR